MIESRSQPSRIFTVTGQGTASFTARTIFPIFKGSLIRALPSPLEATFGTGHPILISIRSGFAVSKAIRAPSAMISGSLPKSWTA